MKLSISSIVRINIDRPVAAVIFITEVDIKTLAPHAGRSKSSPFRQGYYEPVNKGKYIGGYPIIYRSSWEYRMCKLLDECERVLRWGSECIKVKYHSCIDDRDHEYFPDFFFVYDDNGVEKRIVVEVKPKKYLTKPEKPKRLTEKSLENYRNDCRTYVRNMEKARACKLYCDGCMMEYRFVTEDSNLPVL